MPKIDEYKGNALIVLNPGEEYEFKFGLGKAKMIVEHIESIRAFVDSEGRRCEPISNEPKAKPPF